MKALYVALGAGFGASFRYVVDLLIKKMHSNWLPIETLLINIAGSFVLGLVLNHHGNALLILGTGFAGAFTTWSTFAVEAHTIVKTKSHVQAFIYLALTFVLGIGAAGIGIAIAN